VRTTRGLKGGKPARRSQDRGSRGPAPTGEGWVWGLHAGLAAIENPRRTIHKILATRNAAARLPGGRPAQLCEPADIDALLPPGAVHQGLAVQVAPLEGWDLEDICSPPDRRPVVVIDQITDPQNVGAIFRSAAAFGARAVVMQDRHSPPLSGALAKAATGAVEFVPFAHVVNIARAVEQLTDLGYLTVALEGEADLPLAKAIAGTQSVALVLGAEGRGVRDLVAKTCTVRAKIPMNAAIESLNVSAAAAIALYEATREA
jgi:23S rRNA (guanosine2251-2'-O)-methyltransferase